VRVVRHLQERVLEVRQAEHGLTRPRAQASLADLLGAEDPRLEHMLGMQAIATHWAELPAREQQIVVLRYYRGMTQAQIGQQLGISQMQVSRLLARALGYLRPRLFGQPEYVPGT
jgi:RNA polymerase sigma-B factor